MCYQGLVLHRIDVRSIRAIWEESCHRLDFSQTNNHYIRPIFFGYDLDEKISTKQIEILVVLISVLIHADVFGVLCITTDCMSIHDCFMPSLIGLYYSVTS